MRMDSFVTSSQTDDIRDDLEDSKEDWRIG